MKTCAKRKWMGLDKLIYLPLLFLFITRWCAWLDHFSDKISLLHPCLCNTTLQYLLLKYKGILMVYDIIYLPNTWHDNTIMTRVRKCVLLKIKTLAAQSLLLLVILYICSCAAVGWKLYLNINVLFDAARQNRTLHKAILLETICKLVLLAKRYQCWQGVGEERRRVTRQKRNFLRNNTRELRRPEVLPHPFCTPRGDFSCGSWWWVQLSLYSAALLKIFWKLHLQLQKLPKTAERQLTHWRFKSPLEDPPRACTCLPWACMILVSLCCVVCVH